MFSNTIVEEDVPTPPSKTSSTSNGPYRTDMIRRYGMAIFPPSNFPVNVEPSSDQHSFDDLIYETGPTKVSDYSSKKDHKILFQALAKFYPLFEQKSKQKLLQDSIGNSNTWFKNPYTKKI